MIKANELRRGNIVNHLYNIIQIESIFGDSVNVSAADMGGGPYIEGIDCKDIEPILTTAEWLDKLGFTMKGSHDRGKESWWYPDFEFGIDVDSGSLYYYDDNDCVYFGDVKSVHQLQNIYFLVVGTELKINPLQP